MFSCFGRLAWRHRRLVVSLWLLVLAAGALLSGPLSGRLTASMTGSQRIESFRVQHRLAAASPAGGHLGIVIDGTTVEAQVPPPPVAELLDRLEATVGVIAVTDPWRSADPTLASTDGRTALVVVSYSNTLSRDEAKEVRSEIARLAHQLDGPETRALIGGRSAVEDEFQLQAERDLRRGELVAIPVALVAMVLIFGGLRAAAMPLAVAAGGYLGASIVLLGLTYLFTPVSVFALNVVSMLGLGLGIDYGLLMVSRFREERGRGLTVADAVERTTATAGATVFFSAVTVGIAMTGTFVFDDPVMRSLGLGGLCAVVVSMVAALTLLPALLGLVGARIAPEVAKPATDGNFYRFSRLVQRRAVPVTLIVSVGLALLAWPFLSVRLENGDARSLPRSSEARAAAQILAEKLPQRAVEPVVALADASPSSSEAQRWLAEIQDLPGVAGMNVRQDLPDGLLAAELVPEGEAQGEAAISLVRALRNLPAPFPVAVGGPAAVTLDTRDMLQSRLPVAVAIIAAATLTLLFLLTGSLIIPVKAIMMNVLSLGASFGALVWIFQRGNLSSLLAFDPVGAVDLWLPAIIFLFAFGLSMDYEIFLISRIKEQYEVTKDNSEAVAQGLQRTGRIITSAALLIVIVFAGFVAGEVLTIKQLGVGLALAVIVDATIVRSLLVPATMELLGHRNWWAPARLQRLQGRLGLHRIESGPDADSGALAINSSDLASHRIHMSASSGNSFEERTSFD